MNHCFRHPFRVSYEADRCPICHGGHMYHGKFSRKHAGKGKGKRKSSPEQRTYVTDRSITRKAGFFQTLKKIFSRGKV